MIIKEHIKMKTIIKRKNIKDPLLDYEPLIGLDELKYHPRFKNYNELEETTCFKKLTFL